MLIQKNKEIAIMTLDSIRVQNFYHVTVAWVKLSLTDGSVGKNVIIFGVDKS